MRHRRLRGQQRPPSHADFRSHARLYRAPTMTATAGRTRTKSLSARTQPTLRERRALSPRSAIPAHPACPLPRRPRIATLAPPTVRAEPVEALRAWPTTVPLAPKAAAAPPLSSPMRTAPRGPPAAAQASPPVPTPTAAHPRSDRVAARRRAVSISARLSDAGTSSCGISGAEASFASRYCAAASASRERVSSSSDRARVSSPSAVSRACSAPASCASRSERASLAAVSSSAAVAARASASAAAAASASILACACATRSSKSLSSLVRFVIIILLHASHNRTYVLYRQDEADTRPPKFAPQFSRTLPFKYEESGRAGSATAHPRGNRLRR